MGAPGTTASQGLWDAAERMGSSVERMESRRAVIFRNDGLIDLAAAVTLGISVKDEGAIGYFGTGVKFSVATILRLGGSVSLWRDGVEHKFGTQPTEARGKSFDLVTMDGQPLGFTTEMGRDWQAWMAFREMACNAMDEGGEYFVADGFAHGAPGQTVFIVRCEEFEDAYHRRGEYILQTEPIYANEHVEIRPGQSDYVFYRGVRVDTLYPPSRFTYNLLRKVDLTEDRTLKWSWDADHAVKRGLATCTDETILRDALSCGKDYMEHAISFDAEAATQEFLRVAAGMRGRLDDIMNANPSAMKMARELSLAELGPSESVQLSPVEDQRFKRAIGVLTRAGYNMNLYPIMIVDDLGDGIYGLAKEGRIFIAKAAFQKGTKEVASTLIEEWVHLRTGFGDMTRQLQTWLFDEMLTQIENATGEAM